VHNPDRHKALLEKIAVIDFQIAVAGQAVRDQERTIAEMESRGADTAASVRVLQGLKALLESHQTYRAGLIRQPQE